MSPSSISQRLAEIRARMARAAEEHGRDPASVRLLAVSKRMPVADILAAYEAGQRAFGESYFQEAEDKISQLTGRSDMEWYFIGPMQRNKTQGIANLFDWVLSVDREVIAERLSHQREGKGPLNVLIQVNVSGEESKSGVAPEEVLPLAERLMPLQNLRLRGLMALPSRDGATLHLQFERMAALYGELRKHFPCAAIDTLSMGMSGDFVQAIAHGANLIRIGQGVFGPR